MDKYKEAELWGYATRLKRYCQNTDACVDCPFYSDSMCGFINAPEFWGIEE